MPIGNTCIEPNKPCAFLPLKKTPPALIGGVFKDFAALAPAIQAYCSASCSQQPQFGCQIRLLRVEFAGHPLQHPNAIEVAPGRSLFH